MSWLICIVTGVISILVVWELFVFMISEAFGKATFEEYRNRYMYRRLLYKMFTFLFYGRK